MTAWNCPTCSKSFARKGDLTRHRQLHAGYKPHVCQHCGKAFSQFSGLKTHKNVHSKAKPYICGLNGCKSSFGDPSSCARHRKETHQRVGAYRCPHPHCKSSIKRRSAFAAHLKKHDIDPASIDFDSMSTLPPVLPKTPRIIPREISRRNSAAMDFGVLDGLYPCNFNASNHAPHTSFVPYHPMQAFDGDAASYVNNVGFQTPYTQFQMPPYHNGQLYTMGSPSGSESSPPSLIFSLSPSPAPTSPPDSVNASPAHVHEKLTIASPTPRLSPLSALPLTLFCQSVYTDEPAYKNQYEQWDYSTALFGSTPEMR